MPDEEEYLIPVFLINGQLSSGKTTFISEIIRGGQFDDAKNVLLITLEEGEEEYEEELLEEHDIDRVSLDRDSFTTENLEALDDEYDPWAIILEYNGMLDPKELAQIKLPRGWAVYQSITIMDASKFQLQWKNMQSIMAETVRAAESVIFNRCNTDMDLGSFRRSMKALNPDIDVIFEDEDRQIMSGINEILPYDLSQELIEVEDDDFGIWFIDARERQSEYEGKTFRFNVQVLKNSSMEKGEFAATRRAMTCCEDDIINVGYVCMSDEAEGLKDKDWVMLTAKLKTASHPAYNGQTGPVLEALNIEPGHVPAREVVTF